MRLVLRRVTLRQNQEINVPVSTKDIKIVAVFKEKWREDGVERTGLDIWYFRISD